MRIAITRAGGAKQSVALEGSRFVIGSAASAQIMLEDPQVSPTHCILEYEKRAWWITDLGSQTGTRLGSRTSLPITQRTRLWVGDTIIVGGSELSLLEEEFDASTVIDDESTAPAFLTPVGQVQSGLNNKTAPSTEQSRSQAAGASSPETGVDLLRVHPKPSSTSRTVVGRPLRRQDTSPEPMASAKDGRSSSSPISDEPRDASPEGSEPEKPQRFLETQPVMRGYQPTSKAPTEQGKDAKAASPERSETDDANRTLLNLAVLAGTPASRETSRSSTLAQRKPRTPEVGPAIWRRTAPTTIFERPDTSHDPQPISRELEGRPQLVFIVGPHAERRVFLGPEVLVMGRAEECDVVLHDPLVSRMHAKIVPTQTASHAIEPLKASNPATINGRSLEQTTPLNHGDIITLGASVIEYTLPSARTATKAKASSADSVPTSTRFARFCFSGHVVEKDEIIIGRDPNSELFLDDDSVERRHAVIRYDGNAFVLKDLSNAGTYISSKRIVEHVIKEGEVAHVGELQLQFSVEEARLSIEIAAPLETREAVFAPEIDGASPYSTLYRVALDANAVVVRKPGAESTASGGSQPKKKRPKRVWTPPRDIERTSVVRFLVSLTAVTTLAVVGSLWRAHDGSAFFRRPISTAHGSEDFLIRSKNLFGQTDRCAGCHVAFQGPSAQRCTGCHPEGEHALRPVHLAATTTGKSLPGTCSDCHTEHETSPSSALIAGARCASCHEARHARFKERQGVLVLAKPGKRTGDATLDIKADLDHDPKGKVEAIHAIHERLERQCNNCHLTDAGFSAVAAWSRCFTCHEAQARLSTNACGDCHREHGKDWAKPRGPAQAVMPTTPLVATVETMLVLLAPIGLVLSVHHFSRSRREKREAEQRFEAEQRAAQAAPAEAKFVHNINLDKCVGCASCVNACPNDVLELESKRHKSTVVRFDDCKQCRACEQICPSGALTMAPAGAPPRMVELPDLDANYETNIPGIYLIGEAAGKSLVKNANNLGYRVVQHMIHVRGLRSGAATASGHDVEVICVGSGPGGLSTGITCFNHGLSHIIFEKDRSFASTIQTYPKRKELLAEPLEVRNIGPLPVWDSNKEDIIGRWEKELAKYQLDIRLQEEVRDIKPNGEGGFVVTTSKGEYTCLKVVLATGTRGNPRGMKIPGGDLEKVQYILVDPEEFDERDVMVVGGGDSALEAAIALSQSNGGSNRVSLSYRRATFERAKDRNKEVLAQQVEAGRIKLYLETTPVEVRSDAVVLEREDKSMIEVPNSMVYCMLGADPPVRWLQEIGVRYTKKPENWNPGPSDDLSFLELQLNAS